MGKMKKRFLNLYRHHGLVGFAFDDVNGHNCSIQESSVATDDFLWLGVDGHPMHLTQTMAKELVKVLTTFVARGNLRK